MDIKKIEKKMKNMKKTLDKSCRVCDYLSIYLSDNCKQKSYKRYREVDLFSFFGGSILYFKANGI